LELEQLAIDGPDVFQEMCALAQEGRVAFYNGTYAQPHLQTLSAESNIRQFVHGMRAASLRASVQVYAPGGQRSRPGATAPALFRHRLRDCARVRFHLGLVGRRRVGDSGLTRPTFYGRTRVRDLARA
jgi:hypothetical protein